MEKKELVFWIIASAAGLLYIAVTIPPYLSSLKSPIPIWISPQSKLTVTLSVLTPFQRLVFLLGLVAAFSVSIILGLVAAELEGRRPLPPPTQWEKNQYKDAINHDVRKIEAEAKKADRSIDIQFHSWNGVDHARKPHLIDDQKLYQALENLSRAMNDRNDHRYEKRFRKDNRLVLKRCMELRKLDFLD